MMRADPPDTNLGESSRHPQDTPHWTEQVAFECDCGSFNDFYELLLASVRSIDRTLDPADVAYVVCDKLKRRPHLLRGATFPRAYVLAMVRSAICDFHRKRCRGAREVSLDSLSERIDERAVASSPLQILIDDECRSLKELQRSRLPQEIAALPAILRDVVQFRMADRSNDEIAQILGVSAAAVECRYRRAKKLLAARYRRLPES